MKIVVVGTGYVGLVSGSCFAEMGVTVTCVDVDRDKISRIESGNIPIYEPGLDELVERNVRDGRLFFSTDLQAAMKDAEIIFIAVGTPQDEDGSADMKYVMQVAREIGGYLDHYVLVVTKGTVPVGSSEKVRAQIEEALAERGADVCFDVASNPEFLKEGSAVKDFMSPDRVVVGVDSERARQLMTTLYRPFLLNNFRVIFTDIPSAEMIKYAANSMLATRISFMNDIANLCELVGADVNMVRKGIGADTRIGSKFLYPGCGYGGSCFPKDIKALIHTAEQKGYEMSVLKAVDYVNDRQKEVLFRKLVRYYGTDLSGKRVAIWGLSFKPETDDMREATSLVTIWGGENDRPLIFDYSWREWTGLIEGYYLKRWQMFYSMLEDCLEKGEEYSEEGLRLTHGREAFDANDFYRKLGEWEVKFVNTPCKERTPVVCGDEVEVAKAMYRKYSALAAEYYADEVGADKIVEGNIFENVGE